MQQNRGFNTVCWVPIVWISPSQKLELERNYTCQSNGTERQDRFSAQTRVGLGVGDERLHRVLFLTICYSISFTGILCFFAGDPLESFEYHIDIINGE